MKSKVIANGQRTRNLQLTKSNSSLSDPDHKFAPDQCLSQWMIQRQRVVMESFADHDRFELGLRNVWSIEGFSCGEEVGVHETSIMHSLKVRGINLPTLCEICSDV